MNPAAPDAQTFGRIDVHSHLLPGVDDGCPTLEESLACARVLVQAGYTHCFCTPHIWPNLPHNTVSGIAERTSRLQDALDESKVPLRLLPGGELNLREDLAEFPAGELPTYAMAGRYCLFDLWAERLPAFFWKAVEGLQSRGLQVILAHPERMRAVQLAPQLADDFARAGLLLQGNLQCLADPLTSDTRRVGERYLKEGRYFMLGSDTHNTGGLPVRMKGLGHAIDMVGEAETWRLTRDNPSLLMPDARG